MPRRSLLHLTVGALLFPGTVPVAAQSDAVVGATYPHAPRSVYVAAVEVLEEAGYILRVRSLDGMLLTLPRFEKEPPPASALAPQLRVDLEPLGDSTRVEIAGRAVPGRPRELRGREAERADAVALQAQLAIAAALDSALSASPPPPADPREETAEYGFGRGNPVRVGGGLERGAREQRRFLEWLRGPGGEEVRFRRLGSCCPFPSTAGHEGTGALDAYEVTYPGLERPAVLYLDLYTEPEGPIEPPAGFTVAADAGSRRGS